MSAVYKKAYAASAMSAPYGNTPWEQTPLWHWRAWFGYRMRSYEASIWNTRGSWHYRTYRQHAMKVLEKHATGGVSEEDYRHRDNYRHRDANWTGAGNHGRGRQPKI